jgi:hypothetical protein
MARNALLEKGVVLAMAMPCYTNLDHKVHRQALSFVTKPSPVRNKFPLEKSEQKESDDSVSDNMQKADVLLDCRLGMSTGMPFWRSFDQYLVKLKA